MPIAEYDEVVTIRLNPSMLRQIDQLAEIMGRSRAEMIREALAAMIGVYLNAGQPQSKPEIRT
jgi:predicted transcriptional regulator